MTSLSLYSYSRQHFLLQVDSTVNALLASSRRALYSIGLPINFPDHLNHNHSLPLFYSWQGRRDIVHSVQGYECWLCATRLSVQDVECHLCNGRVAASPVQGLHKEVTVDKCASGSTLQSAAEVESRVGWTVTRSNGLVVESLRVTRRTSASTCRTQWPASKNSADPSSAPTMARNTSSASSPGGPTSTPATSLSPKSPFFAQLAYTLSSRGNKTIRLYRHSWTFSES